MLAVTCEKRLFLYGFIFFLKGITGSVDCFEAVFIESMKVY